MMGIYCKTCNKILGSIADEKIPPNVKRQVSCKTCGEKIQLFRKVEITPSDINNQDDQSQKNVEKSLDSPAREKEKILNPQRDNLYQ